MRNAKRKQSHSPCFSAPSNHQLYLFTFFALSLLCVSVASVANSSVTVLCRRRRFVQQRFDCRFPTGAIARADNLLTNAPFAIDYVGGWQHGLREFYLG